MSVMSIMGRPGDLKVMWSAGNRDETEAARAQFNALRAKGFLAFKVDARGDKGEQIHEFDLHAEKIILAPPLRGGQ